MLPILASVVVISFSGVMMPGPMFAVTLAKSYKSPLAGIWISLGHAVIEVPLILLIYFGFARFFEDNIVQLVLSILGGGMIIWLGISMFRARAEVVQKGKDLPYNSFIAGILTSVFNPFFLLWWATIGSMLVMRFLDFGITGLVKELGGPGQEIAGIGQQICPRLHQGHDVVDTVKHGVDPGDFIDPFHRTADGIFHGLQQGGRL